MKLRQWFGLLYTLMLGATLAPHQGTIVNAYKLSIIKEICEISRLVVQGEKTNKSRQETIHETVF
jgi:hypothetical protein